MPTYKVPGIVHEDNFSVSGPIQEADLSVAGLIGYTEWGEFNVAKKLTSFSDYLKYFGGYIDYSDMPYAVKGFFDEGGSTLYVTRMVAAAASEAAATVTLDTNKLKIDAKYKGAYGNNIYIKTVKNPLVNTTLSADPGADVAVFQVASPEGFFKGQTIDINTGTPAVVESIVSSVSEAGVLTHTLTTTAVIDADFAIDTPVVSDEYDIYVYYKDQVDYVELFKQVTAKSGTANYIVDVLASEANGSDYIVASIPAGNTGFASPANQTGPTALAGGVDEILNGNADATTVADFIGTAASDTGLYSFDGYDDIKLVAAVPYDASKLNASATTAAKVYDSIFIHGLLNFAAARKTTFAVCEANPALAVSAILTNKTAAGFNNKYGAMYINRIKVLDPIGTSSDTKFISPLGHILGKIASVDNLANGGGSWQTAAGGAPYGNLTAAFGVETNLSLSKLGDLNEANINVIRTFNNEGVLIYGGRTLSTDIRWRYINVVRVFMYVQSSITDSTQWAVFRNNNSNTWATIKLRIQNFLNDLWKADGLKGDLPGQAYIVKVGESDNVQSANDTLNGRLVTEVAIAPNRPGEFVIFRWAQLQNEGGVVTFL